MTSTSEQTFDIQTRNRSSTYVALAIVALIALAIVLPVFASRSLMQDLFIMLTLLVLAQLWNLLAGYGGLVSVGQQAFVGIGAYAMFAGVILLGWDPVLAIGLGGLAALVLAVPTAYLSFRLQGAYFAIGTWVIAEVVRLLVAQWRTLGGGTGTSLPRDARNDMLFTQAIEELFSVRAAAARDILSYWLALGLAVIIIGAIYWLLRSRFGLALSAVRDNVEAAKSVGVDAQQIRWIVFLLVALGTGLAGSVIYLQTGRISPDAAFSVIDYTAFVIFIVVIGGVGTLEGPIVGVLVFFGLQNILADYGTWYLMTLGVLAMMIMLVAPQGIWGLIAERTGWRLFPVQRRLVLRS